MIIRQQSRSLLGILFTFLLNLWIGGGVACAQNSWELLSVDRDQPVTNYFDEHPETSVIWHYARGKWSGRVNPDDLIKSNKLSQSSASYSDLTTLKAGLIYWMLTSEIESDSTESMEPVTFEPGYQMIKGKGETVSSFLNRHPEVSQIWAWDRFSNRFKVAEQGIFTQFENTSKIEMLERGKGYWIRVDFQLYSYSLEALPVAVKRHAAAVDTNGNIYSHGGEVSGSISNLMLRYSIAKNQWSTAPSGITSRADHTIIQHDGKLYVWGGQDPSGVAINSLEMFDLLTQQWVNLDAGGIPRYSHSAVVYQNKIYYWGGITDQAPYVLNSMDIYDIPSGKWLSPGPSGGVSRAQHQAIVYDHRMLLLGGSAGNIDIYDFEQNSWQLSIGPVLDRQAFSLGQYNRRVILTGGLNRSLNQTTLHAIYEPGRNLKLNQQTFKQSRSFHQSVVYSGKLFSFGGQDNFARPLSSMEALVLDPLYQREINQVPEISNLNITGGGSDVSISFDLEDKEGDFQIELDLEYSLDDGINWQQIVGISKNQKLINPGSGKLINWNTLADFESDQLQVKIRLIASDRIGAGIATQESVAFEIDNGKPLVKNVKLITHSSVLSGILTFTFDISDIDQDLLDLKLEYSLDGGLNYITAKNITGDTQELDSTPFTKQYSTPSLIYTTDLEENILSQAVVLDGNKFAVLTEHHLKVFTNWGKLISSAAPTELSTFIHSPVVSKDGMIITFNSLNQMQAFNPDGQLRLRVDLSAMPLHSASLDNDSNIYVVTVDGKLNKFNSSGDLMYASDLGFNSCSRPFIHKNWIIFECDSNTLYKIDSHSGTVVTSTTINHSIQGNVVVNLDEQVLITYADGTFEVRDSNLNLLSERSDLDFLREPLIGSLDRAYLVSNDGGVYTYINQDLSLLFDSKLDMLEGIQLLSGELLLLKSSDGTRLFKENGEIVLYYAPVNSTLMPLISRNFSIHVSGSNLSIHEGNELYLANGLWPKNGGNNRNSMNTEDTTGKVIQELERYTLNWHSKEDFQSDENQVRIRLSVADQNGFSNNYGISDLFSVSNGENSTPQIAYIFVKNIDGIVEIRTRLEDSNSDQLNLKVEYTTDGGSNFYSAFLDDDSITNLSPSTEIKFFWNSTMDIQEDFNSVMLRLTANDYKSDSAESLLSQTFAIYNQNLPPQIDSIEISGNQGAIGIVVKGNDSELDQSSLNFEYSIDAKNFKLISAANLKGHLSGIQSPFETSIIWLSSSDISDFSSMVTLRVSAFDGKEYGLWKQSPAFSVNNAGTWQILNNSQKRAYVAGTGDCSDAMTSSCSNAYFWGGRIDGEYTNLLQKLDTTLNISILTSGGQKRIGATLSYVDGKLYVYGGQIKLADCIGAHCNVPVNTLDVYTIATDRWENIVNDTDPRADHSAVVYQNKIYFFGGQGSQGTLKTIVCFDTQSKSWSPLNSGSEPRYGHSAFEFQGQMFVWGGVIDSINGSINSLNSMWVYDIAADEWFKETPGGDPRAFHSVQVYDSKAYFYGGFSVASLADNFIFFEDENSLVKTLNIFDLQSRTWTSGPASGIQRVTHGAAKIENKLIYFGGLDENINELASTDIFSVELSSSQSDNLIPGITNFAIEGYRGDIPISVSITDQTSAMVNLRFEISFDSGITYSVLEDNNFLGLSQKFSIPATFNLIWLSRKRISNDLSNVRLRVIAQDYDSGKIGSFVSRIFSVKNDIFNKAPVASNIEVSGNRYDIGVKVDLFDFENDALDLTFQYSTDGGLNWTTSNNISGDLKSILSPSTKNFVWHSGGCSVSTSCTAISTDINSQTEVLVRIYPSDQGLNQGIPATSKAFTLFNDNREPYTENVTVTGDRHDVIITFDAFDQDLELLNYYFQYSLDDGISWRDSNHTIGLVSSAPSESKTFIWNSLSDIYRDQSNIRVRLIPEDSKGLGYALSSEKFNLSNENWITGLATQGLRYGHSMTLFDQKIYVWGGLDQTGNPLNTLDIYDIRSGAWKRGLSGGTARTNHTATIDSGCIYYWGGETSQGNINTLDIYDINNNIWLNGTSGGIARKGHTAILYNHKILFWGGTGFSGVLNTMDIYDITQNSWSVGASGGRPRSEHSSVLDGTRILHWGGIDKNAVINTMDIYDLTTNQWSSGLSGGEPRSGHTANILGRKMIVWAGLHNFTSNSMDIYHLDEQVWTTGDSGGTAREQHTAVLSDGRIIYFGGVGDDGLAASMDIYIDPTKSASIDEGVTTASEHANQNSVKRGYHSAADYQRKLYVWGGMDANDLLLNTLEIFDPESATWTLSVSGGSPRIGFLMDQIKGKLVITGGVDHANSTLDEVDIYDINAESWTQGTRSPIKRKYHAGVKYRGRLYQWGGEDQNDNLVEPLEIYDLKSDQWFKLDAGGTVRKNHAACEFEGKIYFWGGEDAEGNLLSALDIYDISANNWSIGIAGGTARKNTSCFQFEGRLYFLGGEKGLSETTGLIDIFDVDTNSWLPAIEDSILSRKNSAQALIDAKLYLIGGTNASAELTTTLGVFPLFRSSGSIWSQGLSGGTSRVNHSSIISNGRMFSWGGLSRDGPVDSVDVIDLINQSYSVSLSGGTARWDHTGTFYEGRIFHWGGLNDQTLLNSMDIFVVPPVSIQWYVGDSLFQPRYGHGAVSHNGQIYVLGGKGSDGQYLKTLDILDPRSQIKTQSITLELPFTPRILFSTVKSKKSVYLLGGKVSDGTLSEILEYDLNDSQFYIKGSMDRERQGHASILVDDKIYTFGGRESSNLILNQIEIFKLLSNQSQPIKNSLTARYGHTASLVGREIYLWGGESEDGVNNTIEVYLLDEDRLTLKTAGGTPRKFHTAQVDGSRIFFFGGLDQDNKELNTVDIYNTSTDTWTMGPDGGAAKQQFASVRERGKIYHIGGKASETALDSVDIFISQLSQNFLEFSTWSEVKGEVIGSLRKNHRSESFLDKTYHWGGRNSDDQVINTMQIFDTKNELWSVGNAGGTSRENHQSFSHQNKIYFHGGSDNASVVLSSIDIYKPVENKWVKGISGGDNRKNHSMVIWDGKVYSWGGQNSANQILNTLDIYDIEPWHKRPAGGNSRYSHNALAYDGKMYIFNGKYSSNRYETAINIYDSKTESWVVAPKYDNAREGAAACLMDSRIYTWGGIVDLELINKMDIIDLAIPLIPTFVDRAEESGGLERFYSSASCHEASEVIFLWGGKTASGVATNHLDIYDVNTSEYKIGVNGGTARFYHTASYYQDKIYIWGGKISDDFNVLPLNTMDIYDINTQTWTSGPSGGTARSNHSAIVYNNRIYFYGGYGDESKLDTVDIFDLNLHQWLEGAASGYIYSNTEAAKRAEHSAVELNGKMYVWGGRNSSGDSLSSLDVMELDQWSLGSSGGTSRYNHSGVAFDRQIYFWGGTGGTDGTQKLNTMDIYDTRSNTWISGHAGGQARSEHSAIYHQNKIYFWGGVTDDGYTNFVDIYDLESSGWISGYYGGTSRSNHTAVKVSNKIFHFGGINDEGLVSRTDVYSLVGIENLWQKGPDGGTARRGHTATLIDNKIYFWGGDLSHNELSNTLEIFDLDNFTWSMGVAGGTPRKHHKAVVNGSNIYFWGGVNQEGETLETMDIYNVTSQEWKEGIAGGTSRQNHSQISYLGKQYIWGGENFDGTLNTFESFDFLKGEWRTQSTGGHSRKGHTEVVRKGKAFIWGGETKSGEYINTMDIIDLTSINNQAPEIESIQLAAPPTNKGFKDIVQFKLDISDIDMDKISLNFEYSTDEGDSWNPIDANHFDTSITDIGPSSDLTVIWRSLSDLAINGTVLLKVTPTDGESLGQSKISEPFDLNNLGTWLPSNLGLNAVSKMDFVVLADKFLVWGGENPAREASNKQAQFNFLSNSWTSKISSDSRFVARAAHSSVIFGEEIYHWGGINSGQYLNSFAVYDAEFDIWRTSGVTGGTARALHTANNVDFKMYVWGGQGNEGYLNSLQYYDFLRNVWVNKGSGGTARRAHSSVYYDNKLFFFGGEIETVNNDTVADVRYTIKSNGDDDFEFSSNILTESLFDPGSPNSISNLNLYRGVKYTFEVIDPNKTLTLAKSQKGQNPLSLADGVTGNHSRQVIFEVPQNIDLDLIHFCDTATCSETTNKIYGTFQIKFNFNRGTELTDTLDIYDLETGVWSTGAELGVPLAGHKALVDGGRMWIWGGSKRNGSYSNDLYIYDFRANTWIKGPSGGTPRKYHAAAYKDGILYFYGGWNGEHLSSMDRYSISK